MVETTYEVVRDYDQRAGDTQLIGDKLQLEERKAALFRDLAATVNSVQGSFKEKG